VRRFDKFSRFPLNVGVRMRSVVPPLRRRLAASSLVLLGLVACGEPSPQELLASARRALAEHDHKSAVIHLKSALQQQGNLAEARFLLARALLQRGDPAGAVIELRRALEANHPAPQVVPLLAEALVQQGQFKKATDELGTLVLDDPVATADLKATLAQAYFARGMREQAEQAMGEALTAVPDHVPTLLLQARQRLAKGDRPGATELMQRALAKAPDHEEGLLLQADMLTRAGDADKARDAYRHVIAKHPASLQGHVGLLNILASDKDVATTEQALAAMRKHHAGHWTTTYFAARIALQKGDTRKANEAAEQLMKRAPDHPRVMQLVGALALESKSLLKAEQWLTKALKAAPEWDATRRLLVQTYLNAGEPAKAIEVAQPLLRHSPTAKDVSLVALAYSLHGDAGRAEELYQEASTIDPKDVGAQTALALARLSKGNDEALKDLASISGRDTGIASELALVRAHLERKEYDAALKAVDSLDRKQPGMALNALLRGLVMQGKGDLAAARTQYESALKTDPKFFPALTRLIVLDLSEKKGAQAEQRIEAFLKNQPSHAGALIALAQLRAKTPGKGDEVAGLLNRAVRDNPSEVVPRLALIRYELSRNQPKNALAAAQAAVAALPDRPELFHAMAQARTAAGDLQQALSSFNQVATMRPTLPGPHLEIAQTYIRMNDNRSAIKSAQRALAIAPTLLPAQALLARLLVEEKRIDEAKAVARAVQKRLPDAAAGFALEGDIEAKNRKLPLAEAAYRKALTKKDAGTDEAAKLHAVVLAQGDQARADALAKSWLQDHPKDTTFVLRLATSAYVRGAYGTAADRFAEALKERPDDPMLLNNLAFATLKAKRPGALALAERADRLKPDSPPILHTYAAALAAENQLDKAIEVQRKAVSLRPGDPEQRLALARLYLDAGDRAQARKELGLISAGGKPVRAQKELDDLRKQLN